MQRFVSHYTCKKVEQTGVTCLKILSDYAEKKGVYERRITDYSITADNTNKKITKNSPWNVPIIYDLALLSEKNHKIIIVNEDDSLNTKNSEINAYAEKIKSELKTKEIITSEIEKELIIQLENNPIMLLINLNDLYNQRNAGIGWIIITEYNKKNDEFIIYDPLYYTRLLKTKYWQRLPNTPKNRFISFKKDYFFKTWKKTKETTIYSKKVVKKQGFKPFQRKILLLTKKDI